MESNKRDYYREQFEIHQHDQKKSWRVIKETTIVNNLKYISMTRKNHGE